MIYRNGCAIRDGYGANRNGGQSAWNYKGIGPVLRAGEEHWRSGYGDARIEADTLFI